MTPAEQTVETKVASLGINPPQITPRRIEDLMRGVQYHTHFVPGTTTVTATAIMDSGFTICTEQAGCASRPQDFKLATGIEIAIKRATDSARRKLWELESYRLTQMLHEIRQDSGERALATMREALGDRCGSSPGPSPGTGG